MVHDLIEMFLSAARERSVQGVEVTVDHAEMIDRVGIRQVLDVPRQQEVDAVDTRGCQMDGVNAGGLGTLDVSAGDAGDSSSI